MEQSKQILLVGNSTKCDYFQILESVGYSVDVAGSEEEADKILASGDYELVVKAVEDPQCVQLREIIGNLVDKLSEERRFLALLLNSTPEAISYLDHNLTYLHCNSAAAEQLGRSINQVIGRRLDEIVGVDSPIYKVIVSVLRTSKPYTSELNTTWPDRPELGEMHYLVSYVPDIDASGKVRGVFASGRDISELKKIEEALRDRENELHLIMDAAPALISYIDFSFRYRRVNKSYERWFGCSSEEVEGRHVREILGEAVWQTVRPHMEQALAGEVVSYEQELPYQSGEPRWVDVTYIPDRDESGFVRGFVVHVVDIGERKRTEEALRQSEERYRSLAEAMRKAHEEAERKAAEIESFMTSIVDGVTVVDEHGKIIFLNDEGRKLLGIPDGESLQNWFHFTHVTLDGQVVPDSETAVMRALRGEVVKDVIYRWLLPWKEVTLSVNASPVIDSGGRIVGATNTFRDVSEKVEFERRQQELLERERRISETLQDAILVEPEKNTPCCEVAVKYLPAFNEAHVGGDFFDIFNTEEDRYGVLIGDVAGKGLAAARQVAAVRHTVRNYSYLDPSPAKVMTLANNALAREMTDVSPMITAFFASVDARKGDMAYVNAGHESALLVKSNGDIIELADSEIVLGFVCEYEYQEKTSKLELGDTLVMVTDGITEARTEPTKLFGMDGVKKILDETHGAASEEIADKILQSAREFGGGELRDDAAIVVFRVTTLQKN